MNERLQQMDLATMAQKFGEETCAAILRQHFNKLLEKEVVSMRKAKVPEETIAAVLSQWSPGDGATFVKMFRKVAKAKKADVDAVRAKLGMKP